MRGPRLPDVLRARGRVPLPRGRPRPRATWTLICLGLVVSVSAVALIGVLGGIVAFVVALTVGPSGEADDAIGFALRDGVVLAVTRPLTRAMTAMWLAETAPEADAAERWLAAATSAPDPS